MKKLLVISLVSALFLGCLKSSSPTPPCTDVDPSAEANTMKNFCIANNIDYTIDSSGIYYQIVDEGTGSRPNTGSLITTAYIGKFLDGKVLDSNSVGYTITLNQLIPAWQLGLQKIATGGHIKMVAPSSLCYGCYGVPPKVPANSILYFDITLLDVE